MSSSLHPSRATFRPIKVADVELSEPFADIPDLAGYRGARVLVRLHGSAVGIVDVPIANGACAARVIRRKALDELGAPILRHLMADALARGIEPARRFVDDIQEIPHAACPSALPTVTVAVCTRDRTDNLTTCLDALVRLDPPADEIVIVDNAPRTDATARLVARYAGVKYVQEARPGLDWARNRAIASATSEIVAFTDDDVVVDARWVGALRRAFAEGGHVAAVTGLVMPLELETEAQELFEAYGGFGRGCVRRWYSVGAGERAVAWHGGTGKFGTGANMAFRRSLFDRIGHFDPALDVGTPTNGGGDLEMFFRVVSSGHVLMYEPDAIVWHRHRRSYAELREQLTNNGIGFYSYLVRGALQPGGDRGGFARLGLWWLWWWNLRRLAKSLYKPGEFPIDLILAELAGSLRGLRRYPRALRAARRLGAPGANQPTPAPIATRARETAPAPSVRKIEIAEPVGGLTDVTAHGAVDLFVTHGARLLGSVRVANREQPLGPAQLREAIAEGCFAALLSDGSARERAVSWGRAMERLQQRFGVDERAGEPPLDPSCDVSIVIATCDRPGDLRRALRSLSRLRSARRVEIVVVDNHPASGLTAPVVSEYPAVRLVEEERTGLSYARNAGIAAATGTIVVTTDDDVVVPPHWIEALVAPLADPEVMAVTGNVLPLDLSARSQRLFEAYGGLGRGLAAASVGPEWFWAFRRAVPTWTLGGTANGAFRASIFRHPGIGLFDEALGAGTPSGCSEDTEMFYRVLRAGFRIVYQPQAYVWHGHRTGMRALRRQIYAYAKGQVAYQLTTLTRYRDWRALSRLFVELPRLYAWRVRTRLLRRSAYPLSLVALEIAGSIAGPVAWLRSRRRVERLGRSALSTPGAAVNPQPGRAPAESLPDLVG